MKTYVPEETVLATIFCNIFVTPGELQELWDSQYVLKRSMARTQPQVKFQACDWTTDCQFWGMAVKVYQSACALLDGVSVRRSVCNWVKGSNWRRQHRQYYGPQGQCRDGRDGKPPGVLLRSDPRWSTVQEGAGEAVRSRQKPPQKTAQEIQRGYVASMGPSVSLWTRSYLTIALK